MRPLLLVLVTGATLGCRGSAPPASAPRPSDVVLVTIDTLRSDALGFAGNREVATPNLDRLAQGAVVFADAHAHNVMTLPSHANILTGLYPYQHGVRDNAGFRLDASIPTLATLLKARGYRTAAFIGGFPLDSRFGLARGFDVYDERYPPQQGSEDFVVAERPGADVVAAARAWLAATPGPRRFLWVHLYDCHVPYRPPPPFDRQYAANPYLGEVAGVDAALGPLVRELEQTSPAPFLVVTADHGEALGDHGEKTHGLFAYEATLRVPLLLWSGGFLSPRRDEKPARHVDIAPTILDAIGAPVPAGLPGVSLLRDRPAGQTSYFEALSASLTRGWAPLRGVVSGGRKYVELPIAEVYDLAADPGEKRNVAGERPDLLRSLARALPPGAPRAPAVAASSEEQVAKLRSLGYLSGRSPRKDRYGVEDDPKTLLPLDTEMHRMVDLYSAGKAAEAESVAADLVRRRPTMATGYEYLSFLQGQLGRVPAAVRTLEEARRRDLLDERLARRLALLYSELGESRRALALLEPLSRAPDPDVRNALGMVLARANRTPEALQAFRSALKVHPGDPVTYQNLGITELNAGNVERAGRDLQKAIALNPLLPRAWNALGVARQRAGDSRDAVASWRRAVAIDPRLFDAWLNLAAAAGQRGDASGQIEALRGFLAGAPRDGLEADVLRARATLARLEGESGAPKTVR